MKMAPQIVSEIQPGDALCEHHFEFRRTKQISNISQSDAADYIGKIIRNGLAPGHVLSAEDFE
jgi:flagella basal body P-ring formation protein FlgA